MPTQTDIVIAGSGLNGASLALAAAAAGFRVTLVDPVSRTTRRAEDFDGRGYALALSSARLLQALDVWDGLHTHAEPILKVKVSDGRAGEGASSLALEFDHHEINDGPMGYMIEDRFLRRALQDALDATENVTQIIGRKAVDHVVHPGSVQVVLDDGEQVAAGLLVASEGRHSPSAKRAGIKRSGWEYGQTALVCAVQHERPHDNTAHQFFMPPGPLAILPLPGNQSSIVWTETHEAAAAINQADDAAYLDALRPRFGDFLGEISLAGGRFSYPLILSVAEKFYADRLALLGDSAHAVHPIAGQGLNAGLKDVAALVDVLVAARRRGEDIGTHAVLARYERWRRFDVLTLAASTDSVNKLFSNDNPSLRVMRDLGLAAVNGLTGLKRGLIREAAGLSGDLPKLLRGLKP